MPEWWDINISVEVESEDVCDELVDKLLSIACDGYDVDGEHYCRRQFAASRKPSPDMDEEDAEETKSSVVEGL